MQNVPISGVKSWLQGFRDPWAPLRCPLQLDFELSALSSLIVGVEVTQNCTNGSICIYLPHPPVLLRPPKVTPKSLLTAPGIGGTSWVRS